MDKATGRAALGALKEIWALLTKLGVTSTIVSALLAGALTVWSYVRGMQPPLIVFIAVATFCVIFVFYNSARLVFFRFREYPDYEAWDIVQDLAIWQIACLWAKQRPYSVIHAEKKAYPLLQMLKNDIDRGILEVTVPDSTSMWRKISRARLIEYAKKKNEKPPFLFPRER